MGPLNEGGSRRMKMTIDELRALAQEADRAFRTDEHYAVAVAEEWHRRAAASAVPDERREARRAQMRRYYHERLARMTPEEIKAEKATKREASRARRTAAGEA